MSTEYQNNIPELPKLNEFRYENLLTVYQLDGYYVYNLINSLSMDTDLDQDFYYDWVVDKPIPWTGISYIHYETINLWWLICIVNGIMNPIQIIEAGNTLKILKPEYVRIIIDKVLSVINE
jgi:hypothetical protein